MPWTEEAVSRLLALSQEGKSLEEMGAIMGRKPGAIRTKLKRLRPGVSLKRVAWTEEDKALLVDLKEKFGLGWSEIAVRLGRPSGTCYTKYQYLKHVAAPKGPRVQTSNGMMIPREVFDERDRRQAAPLTVTGFVLGDPPIGFSALDRKMAGASA
jgi:hypothetical protein